jgi:hypothetical protein
MKELFLAMLFVGVLIGSTVEQWAPDAWVQILHLLSQVLHQILHLLGL